ncbi:hypothetical protein GWI33_018227 [Rhynchophorus ferrugineus]|uniref:Uncharacterized protein n=1 Tax=Rhynchophorus ferrugineus TaxID=354439 RepID=A0A834HXP5_RHYFE|nr:hypothetical protein GWI33_018227 [Rhynchophorus ferrugineus]
MRGRKRDTPGHKRATRLIQTIFNETTYPPYTYIKPGIRFCPYKSNKCAGVYVQNAKFVVPPAAISTERGGVRRGRNFKSSPDLSDPVPSKPRRGGGCMMKTRGRDNERRMDNARRHYFSEESNRFWMNFTLYCHYVNPNEEELVVNSYLAIDGTQLPSRHLIRSIRNL